MTQEPNHATQEPNPAVAYPEPDHAQPSAHTADRVARLVTELGVGWAKYGLTVGRLALRQSARALETTSELLGAVADRVEKYATPPDVGPVSAAEPPEAKAEPAPETKAPSDAQG